MDQLGFANDLYLSSSLWSRFELPSETEDPPLSVFSLKRLSISAVLQYPPLVEEISTHLPQQLRKEMIYIGLVNNFSTLVLPLFYTWSNPRLALRDLHGDDMKKEDRSYLEICQHIIVQYVTEKIISIKTNYSKAVRVLDLTGCLISRNLVEQILESKFTSSEKVTLVLDVMVSSTERGYSKWVSLMAGSDHVEVKVQNLWIDNVREAQRNALLSEALKSNENLSGLKISKLGFEDWPELYRGLTPLLQFSRISRLDLSGNNLIDTSDTDLTGREWINSFLKKFPSLSRLDLSRNAMAGKTQSVLAGLTLSYLSLSQCNVNSVDLAFLLSLKTLKHLDISGLYTGFSLRPSMEHFHEVDVSTSIEILNLSFWQPTSEEFLIILEQVFRKLRNLKYLNLSFCQLDNPQISKILKLRIPTLQFKMISNYYEGQIGDSGPALSVAMSELLNDHGYYSSNVSIQQDQWDMALRFRAILH